jgi:formylglycine-generating enzyme required for sulfatase activity
VVDWSRERLLRLSIPIVCCVFWLTTGCVLDWSGGRPDARAADAAPLDVASPDVASPDAPAPDLDAGADGPDMLAITADAFVAPGPWETISPGTYTMGSPLDEPCRSASISYLWQGQETQHKVQLTHAFEINALEVTTRQFNDVMGYKPAHSVNPVLPVAFMSWHIAVAYCNELSTRRSLPRCYVNNSKKLYCNSSSECQKNEVCDLKINRCARFEANGTFNTIYDCPGYRLPTEAEWEYAYRAGSTSGYYNGKAPKATTCDICWDHDPNLDPIAWYCGNVPKVLLQPGGKPKQANAWGLYNMAGNLSEWCHDDVVLDLGKSAVIDPVADPKGPHRIFRGGSYWNPAFMARAALRAYALATDTSSPVGLRCVRTLNVPDAGP